MKLTLTQAHPSKQAKTCLILGVFDNGDLTSSAKLVNQAEQSFITKLIKRGIFKGTLGEIFPIFYSVNSSYDQILLIGCGKKTKLAPPVFRKIVLAAARALRTYKIETATTYLTDLDVTNKDTPWKIKQITETLHEAFYRFDLFKSDKESAFVFKELFIYAPENKEQKACLLAIKEGQAISDGVSFTKNLANLPSNVCTPSFLADQAKELAKSYTKIITKVLGEKEMEKMGMGALLGVSRGSAQEAKLITVEYKGANPKQAPVALVGKGVTFDTGGISLKPADSMVGMKYDMCGAATVLGTIKAAAELKLPINIVGVIPTTENMPGGTAYKPEDILTTMSGITVEVMNTDAEGRLILCDALTYCERFKPDVVIDIATLTGAVVIALGLHATGLLTNHEPLAKALLTAGEESNDRAWQLPLWDEYQEQIKSPFADIANTGGRSAGTITAACFLSRFANKFSWAHLDVAGTAAVMGGTSERLATGRPVPMLIQYLINRIR